ncbi:MAG TPA: spermidine/putrescine ABC transporter substrate-binding protein [Enteractinococcus helveticum]|uniref:Spermidine/putrescine ABC transporter substrate-binding protein n=1 Tax=Enteractinococcus helveticum TaxID=1837282 RepID=A0A921FKN8_9MICC|nr:spermidine/putrescine ABC transporter substrate-binding protein [Enteractinococcus helveticum]HJF13306.1 spermidine/putrescine ABC transporter substrate-binding protein [Enteractinococcus helveticum]
MDNIVKVIGDRAFSHKLTRRTVLSAMMAAGVGVLTACGRTGEMAANVAPDGTLEDKLNVYTWGDYDDPEVLGAFGDRFDVVLQVDSYGSNEELIAKLGASRGTSGYDIVCPTDLEIPQLIENNLIQKLDMSLIPNFETIDAAFKGQRHDPNDEYSIVKAWGTTGYVYDVEAIPEELTTWEDFIRVAQKEASGSTLLLEDPWEVVAIALAAKGYDLNTSNDDELEEAREIVVEQIAPHIRAYSSTVSTSMIQGGFKLLQAFNGDARQGFLEVDDPDRWKFVFPTPTANRWTDTWCLATGAPHPDAAHRFIDYIIAPEQAVLETDYIGYSTGSKVFNDPSVEESYEYPELIFPTPEIVDRLTPSLRLGGEQTRVDIYTAAQVRSGS